MRRWPRRARLFIAKSFQIRYISLILIFMFAIVILTGYTVYVTAWVMFGEKLAAVYPQGLLIDIFKKVNLILISRLIIVTPIVIFIGLVLSNRIAGPIYHIKKYLSKISAGNYEDELKLRKNDELQDLAASINKLVSRLRSEKDRRLAKLDALKKEADDLAKDAAKPDPSREKLTARIIAVGEELENIKEM